MQSLPLPFGAAGLDRASGTMATRPGTLRDARNVYLRAGKAEVRAGMAETALLPPQGGHPCTHICLLEAVRFERVGVAAGYYAATRELHLYRLTGAGTDPTHIGPLFTLAAGATEPPRLHAAEVGGKLFIAHDEPLQSRRGATYIYDPLGDPLTVLSATLSAVGDAPVRFRGVLAWQAYLIGWGFSHATESRPEIVRASLPGQPTEFDPNHYFIAGVRGDPVLSCRPAGGHLLAMKASQTLRIHGSSHLDFGILPLHALTGALGHALTIELDGNAFAWSAEGPVVLTGAVEPGRLEVPLDLAGPQPADFAGLDYSGGYVQYVPGRRVLEWVFGTQSFVLSLDSGEWAYGESALRRSAGALLYTGASLADDLDQAPTGYARDVVVTPHATVAEVSWTNAAHAGNEVAEVWLRPAGGAWTIGATVELTEAATAAAQVKGLTVTQGYELAVRFRRSGRVTPGYEDGQQSQWPAASRAAFTTLLETPVLDSAEWERTSASSERARLSFTPADPNVKHQVLRDNGVVTTLEAGVDYYDDTGVSGETSHTFALRAVIGQYESELSNTLSRWMGPQPAPLGAEYEDLGMSCGPGDTTAHRVTWVNGNADWETEIRVAGSGGIVRPPGETQYGQVCADSSGEKDPEISLRHRVTTFGTHDYTPSTWAGVVPIG